MEKMIIDLRPGDKITLSEGTHTVIDNPYMPYGHSNMVRVLVKSHMGVERVFQSLSQWDHITVG